MIFAFLNQKAASARPHSPPTSPASWRCAVCTSSCWTPTRRVRRWTGRSAEASRACHGCSAPWASPAKRCIRKRRSWPAAPITSSSTARRASLARSALLAAERVLIPVQPSPYDLWASAEMVALIREAQVFRPALRAAFVINRRVSTTIIGREARQSLAEQPLPALRSEVRQRIVFADSVAAGRLAREIAPDSAPPHARSPRSPMNCCGGRHERPAQQARRHRRTSARESARRGVDSPGRCRCTQQRRPLHRTPHARRDARAARTHQDRRLRPGRDRSRTAARSAGTGVSENRMESTP